MRNLVKSLVKPIQMRILAKHMCVACTRNLDIQDRREPFTLKSDIVACVCGRVYIYDREHHHYRRAIPAEVRSAPGLFRQ